MRAWLQRKFINWLIRDLYRFITEEEVLTVLPTGRMLHRGKLLPPEDEELIRREAESIRRSFLWKLLLNTVRYEANKRIFEESETTQDLVIGKSALWVVQLFDDELMHLSDRA